MDFSNLNRSKSKLNVRSSRSSFADSPASKFDPAETKQLNNPRVSLEKNSSSSDFIPRVIDSESFNFEGTPQEEEVSMISNFISKNKVTIGIVIILIVIVLVVIYLWYYYSKKKNTGFNMFNKNNVTPNKTQNLESTTTSTTLKVNKPVVLNSIEETRNDEDVKETKQSKSSKKKTKSKSQKNEIQIPSRKEIIDKSKEINTKIVKNEPKDVPDEFTSIKKEPDVKSKPNVNFLQNDDSEDDSFSFYNNK
jgi:hypothetical protein